MASNWVKNWKSLKIFFRTTGWIETKFSQNAGTAHPLEQMRASSNQIIVFTQLEIYKLQSFGPIWPSGFWADQMQKVNGWQTTDTKWWEKLIQALGPGELKTVLRTMKWTLLPCLNTIGPVVLGKRSKCRSLLTTSRDGHQVMIIPLITLKGLIIQQYKKSGTPMIIIQILTWHKNIVCINCV
jgi:hypothetical protein